MAVRWMIRVDASTSGSPDKGGPPLLAEWVWTRIGRPSLLSLLLAVVWAELEGGKDCGTLIRRAA